MKKPAKDKRRTASIGVASSRPEVSEFNAVKTKITKRIEVLKAIVEQLYQSDFIKSCEKTKETNPLITEKLLEIQQECAQLTASIETYHKKNTELDTLLKWFATESIKPRELDLFDSISEWVSSTKKSAMPDHISDLIKIHGHIQTTQQCFGLQFNEGLNFKKKMRLSLDRIQKLQEIINAQIKQYRTDKEKSDQEREKARDDAIEQLISKVDIWQKKLKNMTHSKKTTFETNLKTLLESQTLELKNSATLQEINTNFESANYTLEILIKGIENVFCKENQEFLTKFHSVKSTINQYSNFEPISDLKSISGGIKEPKYLEESIILDWKALDDLEKKLHDLITQFKAQEKETARINALKSTKAYKLISQFQTAIKKEVNSIKQIDNNDPRIKILDSINNEINQRLADYLQNVKDTPQTLINDTLTSVNNHLNQQNLMRLTDDVADSFSVFMRLILQPLYEFCKYCLDSKYMPHFFANESEVRVTKLVEDTEFKLKQLLSLLDTAALQPQL